MISFDLQHLLLYSGGLAGAAGVWVLNEFYERRQYDRQAALVRSMLATEHCSRCGGKLEDWDGIFHPGDIHFNPGGYIPKLTIQCVDCHSANNLYFYDEEFGEDGVFADASLILEKDLG